MNRITINGVEINSDQLHELVELKLWKQSALIETHEACMEGARLIVNLLEAFDDEYPDRKWLR